MEFYMFGMDAQAPAACARRFRQYGYAAVVNGSTKPEVIEAVVQHGLSYDLSVGAFGLGGGFSRLALDCEGRERKWFSSGCPSDPALRAAKLEQYERVAATPGVRAVMLDGARFASFASQEGVESFFTCFCDTCMRQAEAWGYDPEKMQRHARAFRRFTQTGAGDVQALLDGLSDWLSFREKSACQFIRDFSEAVHRQGKQSGAFVFAPSLARWVGQEAAGSCGLDILAPMLYRRYPHEHGPACLNHEWAALMKLMTEKTGLSIAQAAKILCAPQREAQDILTNGFEPERVGEETARLRGGACRLAPILQREDERLTESIRSAAASGAQAVGLFAYDTMETLPDLRAVQEG